MLSPATEESRVTFENLSFTETPPKSIIEAAASGAMTGLKIAAGVATVVMAFVAIIALINGIIGGIGGWFGLATPLWKDLWLCVSPAGVDYGRGLERCDAGR